MIFEAFNRPTSKFSTVSLWFVIHASISALFRFSLWFSMTRGKLCATPSMRSATESLLRMAVGVDGWWLRG